jgi:PilZ domain
MAETTRFVVLCIAEREAICTEVLSKLPFRFRLVVRPRDVMRSCLEGDVAGALIDAVSALRVGIHEMAAIYDMGINLPVLRVSGWEAGAPMAMCNAPFKKLPILEALTQISQDDAGWQHPIYSRKNLRVPMPSRVLIQSNGVAQKAYCANASIKGAYLICWDAPSQDEVVNVTFLDLPFPMSCDAVVRRNVPWNSPKSIPGCGLSYLEDQMPDEYRHLIVDIHFQRQTGSNTTEISTDIPEPSSVFPA